MTTLERTCDRHACAAVPCYLHRRDQSAHYVETGLDEVSEPPTCPDCGSTPETVALAGGGSIDARWRERFDCECGAVIVVDRVAEQRTIEQFVGSEDR